MTLFALYKLPIHTKSGGGGSGGGIEGIKVTDSIYFIVTAKCQIYLHMHARTSLI